jgi:SAM-dependent methyltransferase
VVDIGCGTGLTTGEAARAAAPGRVVGVDVSARMLEGARQVTAAERPENFRYELRLAQVHRSDHAGFDGTISRFGTMFFSDPGAAFGNIAAALRPGRAWCYSSGRDGDNERARAIDAALGDAAHPARAGTDPLSLGDADATAGILAGAGFGDMHFADVHEPVLYEHDLDETLGLSPSTPPAFFTLKAAGLRASIALLGRCHRRFAARPRTRVAVEPRVQRPVERRAAVGRSSNSSRSNRRFPHWSGQASRAVTFATSVAASVHGGPDLQRRLHEDREVSRHLPTGDRAAPSRRI